MTIAAFISSQRTDHNVPHTLTCRALDVSESWFYKRRGRPPTPRQVRRTQLDEAIQKAFTDSQRTYGSPRVVLDLADAGWKVSVNTVAGVHGRFGAGGQGEEETTRPHQTGQEIGGQRPCPPPVSRPGAGCAVVRRSHRDRHRRRQNVLVHRHRPFSRRLLGYAMGPHHDAEVAVASLEMAAATRGGDVERAIFHSDRGSEYTAEAFEIACGKLGVTQSMARVGSALDNAAAETSTPPSRSNTSTGSTSGPARKPD